MDIFIAWDGDHIGREVGRASLADDVEGLRRISQNIDHGNQIWKSWVESHGGSLISMGGDEGRAQIPADYLDELPKIRQQYSEAVDAPVSVGVGTKLSEADKALVAAKLQGGDRVVFYTDEVGEIVERARSRGEKTEEQKIADEYLNKAAPAMNPGAFSGASRPSAATVDKPVPTQGEHSEAQAARDTVEASDAQLPAPEMTHAAADFEDHLHAAAADQEKQDNAQAIQSSKNIGDVKQRVAQALMMLKQQAPMLEQLKQASPESYAAVTGLAQAVVGLAREIQGGQPMQKAEKVPCGNCKRTDYVDIRGKCCDKCMTKEEQKTEVDPAEPVKQNEELDKAGLPMPGAPAHHHVVLPVGSTLNGKVKVQHSDGSSSWKQVEAGMIRSQDPSGHPTSSRSPNSK